MLTINIETARRFILGKQGLWPGRRWRGARGAEQAMRAMEYLQLDPLQIIARSQDILLHSRVLDYTPGLWEDSAYRQRKFFDWGGWLAARLAEAMGPQVDALARLPVQARFGGVLCGGMRVQQQLLGLSIAFGECYARAQCRRVVGTGVGPVRGHGFHHGVADGVGMA